MQVTEVVINMKRLEWSEAARHLPTQYAALNISNQVRDWHARKVDYSNPLSGGPGSLTLSSTTASPPTRCNLQEMMVIINAVVMEAAFRDSSGKYKEMRSSEFAVMSCELSL